jgi:hypothetical protein
VYVRLLLDLRTRYNVAVVIIAVVVVVEVVEWKY